MAINPFDTLREFSLPAGSGSGQFHSLPALEAAGFGQVSRLPVSLRVVLESVLRHCDGRKVTEAHVRELAGWRPEAPRTAEIPFVVARILLQDFTGVPLLADLAAMRDAARRLGAPPKIVEPLVPVDLVVDHSVQVDYFKRPDALGLNMELEFRRNAERYRFVKWGMQAFDTFRVVPPGIGIVHQVNLEYLAPCLHEKDGVYFPDSLVGTDSHTTMINGLGVVGWGVGGIEAEAGMLGQPIYFLTPDVAGVQLSGRLKAGVTATDLVLKVTEMLRQARVVGKFVEFCGEGAAALPLPDRATLANMAPEYGATLGFFPVDEETLAYLAATGRSQRDIDTCRAYYQAQGMFGMPDAGSIDYSALLQLDLGSVEPAVAGPRRPQDHIPLPEIRRRFEELMARPAAEGGYGKPPMELLKRYPTRLANGGVIPLAQIRSGGNRSLQRNVVEMLDNRPVTGPSAPQPAAGREDSGDLGHGDVLIAAITSCTNTSNPGVMLAAGLLAQKAVAAGLSVGPHVKTSLAPGSRVVEAYLQRTGLLPWLEQLGFGVVAYGCTTCIGNAGPLAPELEETITRNDLVCAAVLSGNRNFEARIHPALKANFLMSPPLVVAFALAGRVNIDLDREALGRGRDGQPVFLRDLWPTPDELTEARRRAADPAMYRELYGKLEQSNPLWAGIPAPTGETYAWEDSTYIAEPPFFEDFSLEPRPPAAVRNARVLAIFGDSVTTDHISPAGSIKPASPAGRYLQEAGVQPADFNSYGSRRGNHEIMMRGTFANVRIRNLMLPARPDGGRVEGGLTLLQPEGGELPIFDAAMDYRRRGIPTIIFAGEEYGTGSSRDWAAKGTGLLGVRAVVAKSFERIHRSNLVCMGVLPLQFREGDTAESLGIRGDETFDLLGIDGAVAPRQEVTLAMRRADGGQARVPLVLRIDTPIEVDYYRHGGILPYVLRSLLAGESA